MNVDSELKQHLSSLILEGPTLRDWSILLHEEPVFTVDSELFTKLDEYALEVQRG